MPQMIMLVGPTGCGKTTYRKNNYSTWPCVSPDDFIIGRYTPNKGSLAWGHAHRMAGLMLQSGEDFIVDAQFVDADARRAWVKEAKEYSFTVEAIVFETPWNQLLKNHEERGARGNYGKVPLEVIQKSYQTFQRTLKSKRESFKSFDKVTYVKWGK